MSSNQPNYAESAENFAKDTPLQLTLRVMQGMYSNPRFWVGTVAVIMVLTIMGPFNTLVDLDFAPRLVYWAGISLFTFPVAMAVSIYGSVLLSNLGLPVALSRFLAGGLGGIPIAGIVYLANVYFAGTMPGDISNAVRMLTYTIPISAAVSVIYYLVESSMHGQAGAATAKAPSTTQPSNSPNAPIFARLSKELGKDIISLQAQDHYVKVTTARGSEMILLRLSDAERELEGIEGTRVHRSWWLTRSHISDLKRENEKLIAVLSNGEAVPVSRTYAKEVRGWFHQ